MKTPCPTALRLRFAPLAAFVLCIATAQAQLVPSAAPSGAAAVLGGNAPFITWGLFKIRPHFDYRFQYSDGVQISPGRSQSSYSENLAPGFLVEVGEDWSFDYTGTWSHYWSDELDNSFDHALSVTGEKGYDRLSLSFSQQYTSSSEPLVETARQTKIQLSSTSLKGGYVVGPVSLNLIGEQKLNFVEASPDWYEWNVTAGAHYRPLQQVDVSIGATAGYVAIYESPDAEFIRPLVGLVWTPIYRVSASLQGGIEERRILAPRKKWLETPTYMASVRYQVFDYTALVFGAGRGVSPSYFQNQSVDSTRWNVALQQRLLGRVQLSLGVDGNSANYVSPADTIVETRQDDVLSQSVTASTTFLNRGTLSLAYRRLRNTSTAPGFSTISHRLDFQIGYRY